MAGEEGSFGFSWDKCTDLKHCHLCGKTFSPRIGGDLCLSCRRDHYGDKPVPKEKDNGKENQKTEVETDNS